MGYRLYEFENATGQRVWASPSICDTFAEAEQRGERMAVRRTYTSFAIECTVCHGDAESPHNHPEPVPNEEN